MTVTKQFAQFNGRDLVAKFYASKPSVMEIVNVTNASNSQLTTQAQKTML